MNAKTDKNVSSKNNLSLRRSGLPEIRQTNAVVPIESSHGSSTEQIQ